MDKPANPFAFPCTGEGYGSPKYWTGGMTLRDYFAAKALHAYMTWSLNERPGGPDDNKSKAAARYAKTAYFIADAMLAARETHDV